MRLPVRSAVAAALACACVVAPAHAQFKMPKVKLPGTGAAVAFNDRVVEITPARLDQFLRGLDAEEAMAAKVNAQDLKRIDADNETARNAYDKQMAAYNPKKQAWDACTEKQQAKGQAKMDGATAGMKADFDQSKMQAIADRIKAAQQKGDMAEVMRLSDSIGRAAQAASAKGSDVAMSSNAETQKVCGAAPVEPTAPHYTHAMSGNEVHEAGIKASGMSGEQYNVLRERVGGFVISKGQSNGYAYTGAELTALRARMDALSAHAETLRTF